MARARISLPVPLSPVMRTLTLVRATAGRTTAVRASVRRRRPCRLRRGILDGPEGELFFDRSLGGFELRYSSQNHSDGVHRGHRFHVAPRWTHTSNVLVPDWPEDTHTSDVCCSADSASSGLALSPLVASTSLALSTQSASLISATSSAATNRALRGWAKSARIDWATRLPDCGGRVQGVLDCP